jgi:putative DNA primase/helicase
VCSLDAHCERPELRTFDGNVLETIRIDRSRLVAAALTVLRAWHVAGEHVDVPPFGSFECWSRRVRTPLVWLDRADPCETVAKVREDDPNRSALLAVLIQWKEAIGLNAVGTVREIINVAITHPDFMAALLVVAASRAATVISNDRLGRWLKQNERKIAAGLSLARAGNTHGYPLWQLIET